MTALPPARILDVDPDAYHRLTGFSASLAKILIASSAFHARDASDRQSEDDEDEDLSDDQRKRRERGTLLHRMVLGKGARVAVIPSDVLGKNGAWTNEARGLRDLARKNGLVPVKEADHEILTRVSSAIKARIADSGHVLDGISEFAIEWHETTPHGPVRCRCMIDHVRLFASDGLPVTPGEPPVHIKPARAIIYELKIVDDAHPDRNERTAESLGYAIAREAYDRALNALYPSLAGRIEFRFLFCEHRRPYALWDPLPSGAFRELGSRRWRRAVNAWAEGLDTGRWPSYRDDALRVEISAPKYILDKEGFTPDEY